jgi:hypothetical protein
LFHLHRIDESDLFDIVEGGSLLKQLEDGLTTWESLAPEQQATVQKLERSPRDLRQYYSALRDAFNEISAAKGETQLTSESVDLSEQEITEATAKLSEDATSVERIKAIEAARQAKAQRIGVDLKQMENVLSKTIRSRGRPAANKRAGDVTYDEQGNPVQPKREATLTEMRVKSFTDQGAKVALNRNMMTITWPDGRVERQQIVPTGRPTVDKEARDAERRAERAGRANAKELKRQAKQAEREAKLTARTENNETKAQAIQVKAELARVKALSKLMLQQETQLKKTQNRLINIEAQQEAKTKIKAFVNKGRKATIHGLFRATTDTSTVNEIKLTAEQIKDLLLDGVRNEEITLLDNLDSIKRLRLRLMDAFQGDTKAVSANMQLLKSMIVTMGHKAGLTPAQYASSFYVDVALKSRVISRYIDSVTAMTEQANKVKAKDAKALAKTFITTSTTADNQSAVDRLSMNRDEVDGMTTPDGKMVSFLWGVDDAFYLKKILADHGQDVVNAIPEMINTGVMTEKTNPKTGVTTRVYTTPYGKLTLVAYNGNFIITDLVKSDTGGTDQDHVVESVAHLMSESNLQGEYRNALRSFLTQLVNQGENITNVSGYENLVKRAIDTSNALSERANQILEVTENLTKAIDSALLKVLGIELPGDWDLEKGVQAVTDLIKNSEIKPNLLSISIQALVLLRL